MFLRKTVIFLMSKNMAHIKLLAFKEYESHYSEIVVCNINNIMLIQILKVIQGKRIKWLILPLHESETDRHLIGLSG